MGPGCIMNNNVSGQSSSLMASSLEAHIKNIHSAIPPSIRNACFPDSLSTLLRNLILSIALINILLVIGSLGTVGIQYLGTATFLVSLTSWCHALSLIMVFGSHVIGVIGRLSLFSNLTSVVRNASSRYETDAYAHGLILAWTASM